MRKIDMPAKLQAQIKEMFEKLQKLQEEAAATGAKIELVLSGFMADKELIDGETLKLSPDYTHLIVEMAPKTEEPEKSAKVKKLSNKE
jgi:hypothetical protein